ncbi:hydrolase 1, exosortase A system-associated [Aliidongia dinghuensis]|uniref:Hydrolase 1, exosortase A system-associated n=1 Tax=Aliidongia dinghuensis TaxID=1867774 RepID=A0A8J2YRR7_9PROT|nr:hydrolase 1, exosortase A system-associated [Aliidongia dinghuensis]GGF10734.1 hydrolase 1, exosortase A system-associated [Aliidongia dinghuensis]
MAGPVTSAWSEEAVTFFCAGDRLLGILTRPRAKAELGLVILPGGLQTRVGAHRQNVLLARALAEQGVATLRFDGRGMGDSEGAHPGFTALGPDIAAAVAALRATVPEVGPVVLYGLCDAATAIATGLPRVTADGAILVNPWIRSAETLAAAHIRSHYPRQVLSPSFWKKLMTGQINPWTKAREFLATLATSRQPSGDNSLADRLLAALSRTDCPMLLLLSDRDMTAAEFEGAVVARLPSPPPPHLTIARVEGADHTFSQAIWWQSALDHVRQWLARQPRDRAEPWHSRVRR